MNDVRSFVSAALCATVYLVPRDIGLTRDELFEVARRAGYRDGEVGDSLRGVAMRLGQPKIRPSRDIGRVGLGFSDFNMSYKPDYRKIDAFQFVRVELHELARDVGQAAARLDRDVLVARGVANGLAGLDVDIAITCYLLDEVFDEKDGTIGHANAGWGMPSQQHGASNHEMPLPHLAKAYPIVRDVIERRVDKRPLAIEPLDAFETVLAQLGHDRFRAWWVQTRQELRRANLPTQPTTVLLLAASLAEASLSFVVRTAQQHGLMKRLTLDEARTWKFKDLIGGANGAPRRRRNPR